MMRSFSRHLRARFHLVILDPLYWLFAVVLVLGMFMGFWVELPVDLHQRDWFGALRWLLVGIMAAVLLGGRSAGEKRVQLKALAMPGLPVHPMIRAWADVTFLTILLLFARVIQSVTLESFQFWIIMKETLLGLAALIPVFFVFTPRERKGQAYHLLDSTVLFIATCLFIELGVYTSPLWAIPASVALAGVSEVANRIAIGLHQSIRPRNRYFGKLVRPYREPGAQFRSDLWFGAVKRFWQPILVLFIVEVGGIWLYSVSLISQPVLMVWTGVFYYFLICVVIAPAGMGSLVMETGKQSTFYGDFDGSFLTAWSILPIHPSRIIRGSYCYVMAVGAFFWLATLLTFVLTGWPYSFHFWIPFLIAIPCLAGFITMSAVGDKPRAVFLAVLLVVDLIVGTGLMDYPGGPGVFAGAVLVVFLVASIIPVVPVLNQHTHRSVLIRR